LGANKGGEGPAAALNTVPERGVAYKKLGGDFFKNKKNVKKNHLFFRRQKMSNKRGEEKQGVGSSAPHCPKPNGVKHLPPGARYWFEEK